MMCNDFLRKNATKSNPQGRDHHLNNIIFQSIHILFLHIHFNYIFFKGNKNRKEKNLYSTQTAHKKRVIIRMIGKYVHNTNFFFPPLNKLIIVAIKLHCECSPGKDEILELFCVTGGVRERERIYSVPLNRV